MKLYGEISKTEELDDGTIKVFGYASSQVEDSDGETITADAMKTALPDYLKFGAVREMHQPKAAGTAIEAEVQDDGKTWFGAHVVDSEAVKKVKAGVYKGFSIGGRVTDRDSVNKSVITGLKLIEVSLVDRPANPEAVFTCYKAETMDEPAPAADQVSAVDTLAAMLDKGEITPERLVELAKAESDEQVKIIVVGAMDAVKVGEFLKKNADSIVVPANSDDALTPDQQIEKGMWNVQDFAGALQSLGYICASAEWDRQAEGDNSPIPAQLREWLAQGVEIFKAMAAEELAEMLADLKEQAGEIEIVQMGAKAGDLAKAGAKFSKATKEALGKVHAAAKECCDHLDKLGYASDDEDDKDGDDKDKAATGDDLAKMAGELDTTKAALADVTAQRDALEKRIKELEAKPAPGKALLKAIAVGKDGKAEVVGEVTPEDDVAPVKKADGSVDDVATAIKKIHASGGKPLHG